MKRIALLILTAAALAATALLYAADLVPATSAGSNESVTLKKRTRVSHISITRGGAVTISTERAEINNATEADVVVNRGPDTTRQVSAVATESVTVGGSPVTFQQALTILGKFHEKWKAEDDAVEAARLAALAALRP